MTEREDELCRRSGALQGDELERVSRDLVELATSEAPLMREDLHENGLVGRDTIDIDAGAMLEAQRPRRKLDAQLLPDAGEDQRLGEPLIVRITRVPLVPATGIRGVAVRLLLAIKETEEGEAVELLLQPRAPPLRLVGDHLQWRRAPTALLDCTNRGDELVVVHLRGLHSIPSSGNRTPSTGLCDKRVDRAGVGPACHPLCRSLPRLCSCSIRPVRRLYGQA